MSGAVLNVGLGEALQIFAPSLRVVPVGVMPLLLVASALARALMSWPRPLLISEISWGLMPILVTQVFARLKLLHETGLTILQVEQNTREVLRYAEHAYVMAVGMAVEGKAAEVARDLRALESHVG